MSLRSAWRHQAGLQADVGVAHLAFDLGAGREGGDRVDDDDVERAGAHEHLGDLERLLAGVGLGDEQLVDVDADGAWRRRDPWRARRRCRRRCRRCAGPRRRRAWRGWSCRTTRGRRSRRRGHGAGRRRRGRGRGRARRWGSPRSSSVVFSPIFMIEPLPNCFSICPTAISSAFLAPPSRPCSCVLCGGPSRTTAWWLRGDRSDEIRPHARGCDSLWRTSRNRCCPPARTTPL